MDDDKCSNCGYKKHYNKIPLVCLRIKKRIIERQIDELQIQLNAIKYTLRLSHSKEETWTTPK